MTNYFWKRRKVQHFFDSVNLPNRTAMIGAATAASMHQSGSYGLSFLQRVAPTVPRPTARRQGKLVIRDAGGRGTYCERAS